jgi:hypothetical protein
VAIFYGLSELISAVATSPFFDAFILVKGAREKCEERKGVDAREEAEGVSFGVDYVKLSILLRFY